ncbi:MAG: ester cyclase [Thermomicrobiaceae bacterium]
MSDPRASVIQMIQQGWNRGDTTVFTDSIADAVTFHYAGTPRAVTQEQMSAIVLQWRAAFPDLNMSIDEIIAEGDIIAARLTMSGTHQGEWTGTAPTGRSFTMALTMFFRFEHGKMVELWESDDQLGFREQLGISPFESHDS